MSFGALAMWMSVKSTHKKTTCFSIGLPEDCTDAKWVYYVFNFQYWHQQGSEYFDWCKFASLVSVDELTHGRLNSKMENLSRWWCLGLLWWPDLVSSAFPCLTCLVISFLSNSDRIWKHHQNQAATDVKTLLFRHSCGNCVISDIIITHGY